MSSDMIHNNLKYEKRTSLFQKPLSRAEVLYEFEKLRQRQRQLVADLADNEIRLKEFIEVTKVLKGVGSRRRCFLSMSGMLVDLEIHKAFPLIILEKQKIEDRIEDLTAQLQRQTKAILDFQKAHDIKIRTPVDSEMKTG